MTSNIKRYLQEKLYINESYMIFQYDLVATNNVQHLNNLIKAKTYIFYSV